MLRKGFSRRVSRRSRNREVFRVKERERETLEMDCSGCAVGKCVPSNFWDESYNGRCKLYNGKIAKGMLKKKNNSGTGKRRRESQKFT